MFEKYLNSSKRLRYFSYRFGVKLLFAVILLAGSGCDNIFSDDEIQSDPRTITGSVRVSMESDFSNIYVYLDGLQIGTFTDRNGKFKLTLPPKFSAAGSALSGVFDLYFYLATCNLSRVKVAIENGQFVFGQEGLDKNGRVTPTPMLAPALRIETLVAGGYKGTAHHYMVNVSISATSRSFPVDLPNASQEFIGGVFIQHLESGAVYQKLNYTAGYTQLYHFTADQSGRNFFLIFDSKELQLPPGKYRVLPHVLPNYDDLAERIADSIGIDPTAFAPDYLRWPMRFIGGELTIAETMPPAAE